MLAEVLRIQGNEKSNSLISEINLQMIQGNPDLIIVLLA
jgi:hypothetical protein